MKYLLCVISACAFLFAAQADAKPKHYQFIKNVKAQAARQASKSGSHFSQVHVVEKEFDGESLHIQLLDEPSEISYKLSQSFYDEMVFWLEEEDEDDYWDDEDDGCHAFDENTDYAITFPKEVTLFLASEEDFETFTFISAAKLQKSQYETAKSVERMLKAWKEDCEAESDDYWGEEFLFEYSPLVKNSEGNYETTFFYAYLDEDPEFENEYTWGKMVITENRLYMLFFYTEQESAVIQGKKDEVFASFQIIKKS